MKKILAIAAAALIVFSSCSSKGNDFRKWAETPPMGWNSWDCYGPTVVESEVKANADFMAENLKEHGWEYVVVDIRWFVANDKAGGYNETNPVYNVDQYGRYMPAENRFPSAAEGKGFKELADYVHGKGLKFGIHIMRGIPKQAVIRHTPVLGAKGITADMIASEDHLCRWLGDNLTVDASKPGAQEYYNSIFDLYAEWGVDFIKIDDLSAPYYHEDEIDLIRKAIDQCGRKIVLSTSPGATPVDAAEHLKTHANMWRMVNDVWDIWKDLTHLMHVATRWYEHIAPGTWPDCDMIPLGHISIRGERGEERMTRLTENEQYSLMTFFTIFRSPLMFGGDLPTIDPFTLSLLTNDEVLRMHRESTDVSLIYQDDNQSVIASRNPKTDEVYLALFNIGEDELQVSVKEEQITEAIPGLRKNWYGKVREITNLWTGEELGKNIEGVSQMLEPHASVLLKLK